MSDKEMIFKNIGELTDAGRFLIKKFDFDEKNFGNFCIELYSEEQVNIRFISDRGSVWCEAGRNGEWYFIEDVFRLIGTDFVAEKSEVNEFLKYMSGLLIKNISEIINVFNARNIDDTQAKIKEIATERTLGMFKTK